ncbi:GNAT family N-acetyltransferase [Sphingomonas adhaesiva]|uniref:GNAT family N-acetyltransferase n=1 Tax=Sphingomonas adhaesiva TaxID=28212 RepID=UPI002FFA28B0
MTHPPKSRALALQVGARTLATIPRRLVRVGLSLDEALAGGAPVLPALDGADGWHVTSLPAAVALEAPGLAWVRQRYMRYYVDLAAGEAAWRAGLSAATRATMKRKAKRLAAAGGGRIDIRRYRTADEMAAFHPPARAVAATTYQERLLGAALPADPAAVAQAAAGDGARGWLLFVCDAPAAYLWCTAQGSAWRYDHVGHDPAFAALSPGAVLMEAALGDLFGDRLARFDFTEGEGQHKRTLASGGVACRDVVVLRRTWANRAALGVVRGFDNAVTAAKRVPVARALAARVRR